MVYVIRRTPIFGKSWKPSILSANQSEAPDATAPLAIAKPPPRRNIKCQGNNLLTRDHSKTDGERITGSVPDGKISYA